MAVAQARRSADPPGAGVVCETDIPARLDRLPWGRFHTLVVVALGITWILDGLEVTLAGSVAGALRQSPVLQFSGTDVGFVGSAYLAGAVLGAIFFGWLTDRLGRKKLFFITLAVYLVATAATAFSWNVWSFALFRFITGAGIGGEYAAINSTIQELVPARVRGWTDLVINGSFWVGAAAGAAGSIVLLDPALLPTDMGWRVAFLIGALLALIILFMRTWLPESPRWLITHGRAAEADAVVDRIEDRFRRDGHELAPGPFPKIRLRARSHTPLREVVSTLLRTHPRRTGVGLALMVSQAFFYNAIFFTYALVLTDFYGVRADRSAGTSCPSPPAISSVPVLPGAPVRHDRAAADDRLHLCRLRPAAGGHRLALRARPGLGDDADAVLDGDLLLRLVRGQLRLPDGERDLPAGDPRARHRHLLRVGTGIGGIAGPLLFGALIETGSRWSVFSGYLLGAALMLGAAVVAGLWGVAAERKPLEFGRPAAGAGGVGASNALDRSTVKQ